MDLTQALDNINVAEGLDENLLAKLGDKVVTDFEMDEDSRSEWLEKVEDWVKLATQVASQKSYPWANASNVKFPLLATASMQFAARAYPSLIPGPEMVTGMVKGNDVDGQLHQRAKRIGRHMSYQLIYDMPDWEEEMDKLCLILPIVGCAFKKTYYDPLQERNVSELVMAQDLAINYWAKSIETASRKTHIIQRNQNEIQERINLGLYLDVELVEPIPYNSFNRVTSETSGTREPSEDDDTPYTILEQHTWYDLDDDGYKEPWIITVEHSTRKVLRIVPRFDEKGIVKNGNKIARIKPVEYFTKFPFIPNPDGGIYDLGFGLLLGGINNSINTLINQLIDAGTLNNLQGGFIGRGIRIRGGNLRFQPGEWKQADFTGEDIAKNIFTIPTKEPSNVLFELFGALNSSGEKLASIMEIATGKLPGQNTPATTTMASVEQSLKIFTAIYKRLYRALTKEYEKLYRLNSLYLDDKLYFTLNSDPSNPAVSEQIGQTDYSEDVIVKPNADPNVVSEAQELGRAQGLLELVQLGTVNVQAATKRILEAQKQVNIAELMAPNPPQPNPEEQEMQMKQQEMGMKMQMEQEKAAIKQKEAEFKMMMEAQKNQMDMAMKQMELQLKEVEQNLKVKHAEMDHRMKMHQTSQQMQIADQQNQQKVELNQATHEQNMKMAKEKGEMNDRKQSKQGNVAGVDKKSSN
jgi:chaperonin GroES